MRHFLLIALFLVVTKAWACDNSNISLLNATTNPDGSVTYTLNLTTELGGLDATFYGFALEFISSQNTPAVTAFPPTLTNANMSSGNLTETLFGLTGNAINSVVGDGNWNQYMGDVNVLSYEDGSIFGAASNDITWTMSVTVMGCVEQINFNSSVNSGSAACIKSVSTGVSCALCSIAGITTGLQTPCDGGTNTYSQILTLTYTNPPGSGSLQVNGQSFAITGSPQQVLLSGLPADGNAVNVNAQFTADGTCSFSANGLFTAPSPCGIPCTPDNGTWD